MVDPAYPQSVVDALHRMGYRAELGTDSAGDPRIRSQISNMNCNIWFHGCTEHKDCSELNLSAAFDLEYGTTLDAMNEWNRREFVGRAFTDDDGDPVIDYFISTEGGMPFETFEDAVESWDSASSSSWLT